MDEDKVVIRTGPTSGKSISTSLITLAALAGSLGSLGSLGRSLPRRLTDDKEHCRTCGAKIPPGRAGRECEACRFPTPAKVPDGLD